MTGVVGTVSMKWTEEVYGETSSLGPSRTIYVVPRSWWSVETIWVQSPSES